jgi:hypothetical protein
MTYDHLIARTGRVQSWLDDSTSRLPVSCTVFVPEDGMEGEEGIESSWRFVSYALRHGAGVAVHLSKLRPKGDENGKGLVASGPVSFAKVYSVLNEILRRGGVYKNGAVTLHLDLDHPDILDFLQIPRSEIPWAKRCVDISLFNWETTPHEVREALIKGIKSGDIWLNKIRHDWMGKRLYGNVCLEVYLPSRGTCLLQHVNLGACRIENLKDAFVYGMTQLCQLHPKTDVGKDNVYLPPTCDRQVGLGMLGLANFLAENGVSYQELGETWDAWSSNSPLVVASVKSGPALDIIIGLEGAIDAAAKVARQYQMERAFAIAPTASCSYRYLDLRGYTTTPEIAPPISREVDRDSGTFGVESFDYGPVETAHEVGWKDFYRVAYHIVRTLRSTGLFHGYSLNTWSDAMVVDEDFIEDWLVGPQTSLYYSLQVMGDVQDKTSALAALGDPEDTVDDLLAELLADPKPQCDCGE